MKILFIQSIVGRSKNLQIGIGHLSSVLKENNHDTRMCFYKNPLDRHLILKTIKSFQPSIVGFSSVTSQFPYVESLSNIIKKKTDALIICGGTHPTLNPECLEKNNSLDAICRGEGEMALLELAENIENKEDYFNTDNFWFKRDGEIIRNPIRPLIENLDSLPFPDRSIFDYENVLAENYGIAEFMFSRGCPFKCSYCSNHALAKIYRGKGKYVRFRSVENSIEEIKLVLNKYKDRVRALEFHDDTFNLKKERVFHFCEKYKENFGKPFIVNIRPDFCDREILDALKKAGCYQIYLGVESGNERLRQEILKRTMTNEQIINVCKDAKALGLEINTSNMVGLPFENPRKFEDTLRINRIIHPDIPTIHIFYPYPGTDLYKLCEKNNWIGKTPSDFVEREDTILNLPHFTRGEILKCTYKFKREFSRDNLIRLYYGYKGSAWGKIVPSGLERGARPLWKLIRACTGGLVDPFEKTLRALEEKKPA